MPNPLKVLLTVIVSTGLSACALVAYLSAVHSMLSFLSITTTAALIAGAGIGLLYGFEAGLLLSYDLATPSGWFSFLLDLTWSYPNTVFGLVVGNLVYPFLGSLSREQSEGQGWISYKFSGSVLQTLGTVNLGGAGMHERVHLFQARLFGPLYLPLFGAFYVVTSLVQLLWTGTLGGLLFLLKVREKPYFRPPANSAVGGFFGWIYHSTPFELWAYAVQ